MTPETDLPTLLATMDPQVRPGRFVFATVKGAMPDAEVLASVVEDEGLSVVVAQDDADRLGLDYDFVGAWITLRVYSSLESVGLTAAVSATLADIGISCNVIAGFHHDHLLVPADRLDEALSALHVLVSA
ncbi:MAG: ACT domain-containing protein [Propionibacterium sp.]|nr:ACT domain-containing protein [Propionibacterium sp.]